MCGRTAYTERHHIFSGTANRKLSEEDGLIVDLCHSCHNEPPNGVHFNKDNMHRLHVHGQRIWEMGKIVNDGMTDEQAREAFIKRYGRNYL
jgi:hypothetical protein